MNQTAPALTCDLTRLTAAQRQCLEAVVAELFASSHELNVLPDGYALGYPDASAETISKIAQFIAYDRLCCGFLTHALVSEPSGGPTWLRITGSGAKEVIAAYMKRFILPGAAIAGDPL